MTLLPPLLILLILIAAVFTGANAQGKVWAPIWISVFLIELILLLLVYPK